MRAGIALGSNLGDRAAFLQHGVEHLRLIHEGGDFLLSSFLETEPLDCPIGSPSFLNAVAELETSLEPIQLLNHLQSIEALTGRPKIHDHHSPRTLDLDILYCDKLALKINDLELPHPRIIERFFVLAPLAEIRPNIILPGWNKSCLEYLLYLNKNYI
jgi:2-amino-4-hydroxy-6-hydroxymethyldihydropteridine diphosphokinase